MDPATGKINIAAAPTCIERSRSCPQLLDTRRRLIREHIGGAIPGYVGHVPGNRSESGVGNRFARTVEDGREHRSRSTFDPQTIYARRDEEARRPHHEQPATPAFDRSVQHAERHERPQQPHFDRRGHGHPAAGDKSHSRIPLDKEEKVHHQSGLGLTSFAHEDRGGAGTLRGYGKAPRGVPGYMGHVPGKVAENIYADTWTKSTERSLGEHLVARLAAPRKWSVMTDGRTMVEAMPSDQLVERPIRNPSYYDGARGWSKCEFTGAHVDPAGRLAPRDRQESYGNVPAPPPSRMGAAIHGYSGWVPGRVGENVVGERQCKTNHISLHLYNKTSMRNTQR